MTISAIAGDVVLAAILLLMLWSTVILFCQWWFGDMDMDQ